MRLRTVVSSVVGLAVYAGGLFGGAGTLRWPQAWAFILITLALGTVMRVRLARTSPELLRERERSPFQRDQAVWDKVFMAVFLPCYVGWLVLMGLDAVRFGWSRLPIWLEVVGGAVICLGFLLFGRIFRANAYAAPVAKVQGERQQRVATTGPYAVVRHPMYAGMLVVLPAVALLLGSVYGLVGAGVLGLLVIARTVLEDRMLLRELDGYAEYTRKVRYRLVPGLW